MTSRCLIQNGKLQLLVEMGLEEFAFEAVILRHPEVFSASAIEISKRRLAESSEGSASDEF
jgi:hypothetical protein